MEKSLKGVLANYGVQEVIENLLASLDTIAFNSELDLAKEIKTVRREIHNDVDFISCLMECYQTNYELQVRPEWRFSQDKEDFEAEADNLIIAKTL